MGARYTSRARQSPGCAIQPTSRYATWWRASTSASMPTPATLSQPGSRSRSIRSSVSSGSNNFARSPAASPWVLPRCASFPTAGSIPKPTSPARTRVGSNFLPQDEMPNNASTKTTRYIFVTGGVVSSLGKGIAAASLGRLLVERGLTVSIMKFDPYLNVDPGTMSPFQHGEVFVTDDGAETDLDLGHYERFIDRSLSQLNNVTTGRI